MFSKVFYIVILFFLFNSPQAFASEEKDSSLEKCKKAVSRPNISILTDTVGKFKDVFYFAR